MPRQDANTEQTPAVARTIGTPATRMRDELTAIAKNDAQFGNSATEMAEQAANKMLDNADNLDAIFEASERAGISFEDLVGQRVTLTGVRYAPSSDRFKATFGVFAIFDATDKDGAEVTFTSGAGNIVSAGRAFELGNHYPVEVTLAKRQTGSGDLYYFTR
jgi:hypothetical protein